MISEFLGGSLHSIVNAKSSQNAKEYEKHGDSSENSKRKRGTNNYVPSPENSGDCQPCMSWTWLFPQRDTAQVWKGYWECCVVLLFCKTQDELVLKFLRKTVPMMVLMHLQIFWKMSGESKMYQSGIWKFLWHFLGLDWSLIMSVNTRCLALESKEICAKVCKGENKYLQKCFETACSGHSKRPDL